MATLELQMLSLFLAQYSMGSFFTISGALKLWHPIRRRQYIETFCRCHIPLMRVMLWLVPALTMLGGLALLTGIMVNYAAFGLALICVVALATERPPYGIWRAWTYAPLNKADLFIDFLYLPEVLYIIILLILATAS